MTHNFELIFHFGAFSKSASKFSCFNVLLVEWMSGRRRNDLFALVRMKAIKTIFAFILFVFFSCKVLA